MAQSSGLWPKSGQSSLTGQSSLSINTSIDSFDNKINEFGAKVDRKLLEKMMDGSDASVESAHDFFARASGQSGAKIYFPEKWELQIMSPNDPEIRIIGNASQVRAARKLIMDVMDPYRNRVVLKIDVSFTDHSFIIGEEGKRIKSIMDATQTQIHFPVERLLNAEMKSNVVTITGNSLERADEARQTIREALPLTVGFPVIVSAEKLCLLDNRHPIMEYYKRRYNVIIAFKRIELLDVDTVAVNAQLRGSRSHFEQLHEATRALHSLFESTDPFGIYYKVITINIEISPRHQSFVMGVNNSNIRDIVNRTGAKISFPNIEGINSLSISPNTSTVSIEGVGIESAFMAWLQLLEFLPVVLLFDIKTEQINGQIISTLMLNQLLTIEIICPKINSEKRTIIVKTQERHTDILFEARKHILNIREEPKTISTIP